MLNSVRQDLALLEFVLTFLKCQYRTLLLDTEHLSFGQGTNFCLAWVLAAATIPFHLNFSQLCVFFTSSSAQTGRIVLYSLDACLGPERGDCPTPPAEGGGRAGGGAQESPNILQPGGPQQQVQILVLSHC